MHTFRVTTSHLGLTDCSDGWRVCQARQPCLIGRNCLCGLPDTPPRRDRVEYTQRVESDSRVLGYHREDVTPVSVVHLWIQVSCWLDGHDLRSVVDVCTGAMAHVDRCILLKSSYRRSVCVVSGDRSRVTWLPTLTGFVTWGQEGGGSQRPSTAAGLQLKEATAPSIRRRVTASLDLARRCQGAKYHHSVEHWIG